MKLREELINRQHGGGNELASFGHGSVYVANFSKRDDWSEDTKLPPPADHVQDGLLSPDGKLIALFFRDFNGPIRPTSHMHRRYYVRRLSDHSEIRVGEGSRGSDTDVWIEGRVR